jgi:hypothetical protein
MTQPDALARRTRSQGDSYGRGLIGGQDGDDADDLPGRVRADDAGIPGLCCLLGCHGDLGGVGIVAVVLVYGDGDVVAAGWFLCDYRMIGVKVNEQVEQIMATYDLPVGLLINPDCAGTVGIIKISDITGQIYLPQVWKDDPENAASNPPEFVAPIVPGLSAYAQSLLDLLSTEDTEDPSSGSIWGGVLDWIEERQHFVLYVEKVVITATITHDRSIDEVMQVLSRGIDSWFETLIKWVRILSDQDVNAEQYDLVSWPGRGLEMRRVSGNIIYPPSQIRKPISFRLCRQLLNERQWHYALAEAAKLEAPQIEYILAADARAAARSNQFRRAVLDAATSVELSLNRILDGILSDVSSPIRDAIRSERRTLGQLISVLRKANSLPTDISEQEVKTVVEARNRAIHKGQMPTSMEAMSAVYLAMKIARLVLPLPKQ